MNDQIFQPLSNGNSNAGTLPNLRTPPISISGTPIVYGPSALAVDFSATLLAFDDTDPESTTTNIAGQVVTFGKDTIIIAGTTLFPGAPAITISGTSISLGSSALIIGTRTVPLSQSAHPLVTTLAGHAIMAAPNAVELAGTTLHPGVPGVTLDGTAVSLDTAGRLIVGSKTIILATESADLGRQILGAFGGDPASDASDPMIAIVGDLVITAAPTGVVFAGITLASGAPMKTVSGTLMSLDTAGQLIVGAKTINLAGNIAGLGELGDQPASDLSDKMITTIAGQAVTAAPTAVAFAGTTLIQGAPGKTIDGTLVSLNTAGQLVVGSKTVGLTSESAGLGEFILGAFGANRPLDSTTSAPVGENFLNGSINGTNISVEFFRDEAEGLKSELLVWKTVAVIVVAMALLM